MSYAVIKRVALLAAQEVLSNWPRANFLPCMHAVFDLLVLADADWKDANVIVKSYAIFSSPYFSLFSQGH